MKNLGTIKTLTIASLSVLALTVSIALAQTSRTTEPNQKNESRTSRGERHGHGAGWGKRGGRDGGMRGLMFRGLNLTDDQKARAKQIGQSFRERTQSLRQELQAKRQELRQAGEGGTFNEAVTTQKLQESASLRAKLMGEQFKMRQEMLAVLTPEQKAQMEQKRAEFKDKSNGRSRHKGQGNKPEEE
jgi:protein CpxP